MRSSGGPRSRLAAALPALAPASPQRNFYAGLSSSSRQAYSSGPPSGPLPTAGPKSGQLNPLQSLESLESDVQGARSGAVCILAAGIRRLRELCTVLECGPCTGGAPTLARKSTHNSAALCGVNVTCRWTA